MKRDRKRQPQSRRRRTTVRRPAFKAGDEGSTPSGGIPEIFAFVGQQSDGLALNQEISVRVRAKAPYPPRSSSGSGHLVLTEEIMGSTPIRGISNFGGVGQQEAPLVGSEAPIKRRGGASPLASASRLER